MSLITPAVYREHDPGSSLEDDAIQRLIDSNEAHMVRVLGPHSRVGSPRVQTFRGGSRTLLLAQPAGSVVQVRERIGDGTWTVLGAGQFLALHGGQTIARTTDTGGSSRWAGMTEVTYVPASNLAERVAALLEMVGTDVGTGVNAGGVTARTMGSWSESYGDADAGRSQAKDRILARLMPRAGIVFA